MAGILFEDIFDVKDIDPDGMKFDRGVWHLIMIKSWKGWRDYYCTATPYSYICKILYDLKY